MLNEQIVFYDNHPAMDDIHDDVINGLKQQPKKISPKYFYDKKGSELFDVICGLPEYYLTRTEIALLKKYGSEIVELTGRNALLIELGSGSSKKIRILLEAIRPHTYMPMDISKEHLLYSIKKLAKDFPWLKIYAACVDYSQPWRLPDGAPNCRRIAFFPGSSIGNFEPNNAKILLRQVAHLVKIDGGLLIGVDLKKDRKLLEAAYNDEQGVTADFNLNILTRLNREMDADFDIQQFKHQAFYNESLSRIEMHLESITDQKIRINDHQFSFRKGESLYTECSYKYSISEFHELAKQAGFLPMKVWTDDDKLFSIHYLKVRDA